MYVKEEQARINTLNLSDITITDPETWPVAYAYYQYQYSLSVNQTIQAACQNADWKDPKNSTIRTMGGYTQMWNGFMWLILGYRCLRTQTIPY